MALLDELLVRIGMDTSGVDEGTDEITRKLDGLAAPAAVAGGLAGAVFVAGISSAMDISAAQTKLQNQLGLTEVEAERAGGIAGEVFAAGFGGSLDEVSDAVGAVAQNIGGLGEATDEELQQMSKAALGLAKTFDFDVKESTQALGTLIKSGLAKDGVEALDLLTATAQKLPPAMREELPSVVTEYTEFFDQLGVTGPQMMGLLAEASKNPLFQLDKLADATKEFTLVMAEGSEGASDALEDLDLDLKDIQKLINEGKGAEAFDKVSAALAKVGDQTERTRLQAELFGGPGEDVGNTLGAIAGAGGLAASSLNNAAGASQGLTDSMEADPAQQMDAALRTLQMTLGEALLPLVQSASEFFTENKDALQVLIPVILVVVTVLGVMAAVIWLVNIAMLANPVAWIVLGILALIAVIILVIVYWDEIKAATKEAWDRIVEVLKQAWEWIKSTARETWDSLSRKTKEAWDWIGRKVREGIDKVRGWIETLREIPGKVAGWLGKIVDWVRGMPGRIRSAASGMWDGIKNSFRTAVNWLIGRWNNFSLTLGGGSVLGVSIPSVTLSTPNLPFLAEGGITTGPTLAVIGEGREDEAVLPLSRLEQLISMPEDVRAPSVGKVQPQQTTVRIEVTGPEEVKRLIRAIVANDGGGDVQAVFGN